VHIQKARTVVLLLDHPLWGTLLFRFGARARSSIATMATMLLFIDSISAKGQLSATLRSLWQIRAIPSTTDGLDQQHGTCHASPKNVDRGKLIGEGGILSGNDFEITCDTALVPIVGEIEGPLCVLYR
jgi:hypothetical protein